MPIGKRVYIKSKRTRAKTGKKYFRVKPKMKSSYRAKSQLGLRAQTPITRRKLKMTCLHQYANNCHVNIPNWHAFQQSQTGQFTVVQSFNLSSPQIFDNGGKVGVNTGNGAGVIAYGKPVTDIWDAQGAASMMPGYMSYPVASDQFNHQQILGTEFQIKIRCVDQSVPETQLTQIPIKVMLIPTSDQNQGTSQLTTEDWEAMPYCQTRILEGTNSRNNNTAFMKYRHSNRKFNGIPKGQYLGDNRYLASTGTNQTSGGGGNVANEQEHLKLVFAPLSSNFSGSLQQSIVPPNLFVEIKIKRWIRYTDPNNLNQTFGTGITEL